MTRHETRNFTQSHGVVVSFENAVYNNGVFNNFTAWTEMNKKYGTSNITYIIRHVELLGHDTYEPIRFSIMLPDMNEYSFWQHCKVLPSSIFFKGGIRYEGQLQREQD